MGLWVASLLWQGSRAGLRACTAHCLGTWVRPECTLNSLIRWGYQFYSADGSSYLPFSLFKSLYVGLLNGLCNFLHALFTLPRRTHYKLYLAMSKDMDTVRDMDTVFCLDTVTEAALKPSKHFVVLTESDLHSKFRKWPPLQIPGWTGVLALLCKTTESTCLFLSLSSAGPHWFKIYLPALLSNR